MKVLEREKVGHSFAQREYLIVPSQNLVVLTQLHCGRLVQAVRELLDDDFLIQNLFQQILDGSYGMARP